MTQMDSRFGLASTGAQTSEDLGLELLSEIKRIGLARFVGRINAGLIDAAAGYAAVERFARQERKRPLISTISQVLMGRSDSYAADSNF